MSNAKPKVEIPAWQRAAQPKPAASEDPVYSQPQAHENNDAAQQPAPNPSEEAEPEPVPSSDTSPTTSPQAEEPADTTAPESEQYVFHSADFDDFKQQQQQRVVEPRAAPPPVPQQQRPQGPPIITYPEFLIEAHKPPPLITPTRILNTLYAAGGVSAILYGASKWIISPMVDTLNDSRHDFLNHSQCKVDDFNERLSKIVSKMPAPKSSSAEAEDDEVDSITSDPTELYHRDMGTQTLDPPEARSTIATNTEKKDPVEWASNGLNILKEHVKEIADGSDKAGESHKDSTDKIAALRSYLDTLLYGTAGGATWSEESIRAYQTGTGPANNAPDDAIEDLKKEIRGVKGVLLSAKRFPAASRNVATAA